MNYFEYQPKNNYGIIYKYTSPSGKSYIGQTSRSMKARAMKNGIGYEKSSIFYAAILKYGFNNFTLEILEEIPQDQLDSREIFWIDYYNTLQPNGYNCHMGGANDYQNRKKANTQVYKYSLTGELLQVYNSLTEAAKDNNCHYQTISAVCRHERPQHKNFIYRYENDFSNLVCNKKNNAGRKTAQLDEYGNVLQIFDSANKAAIAIGKKDGNGRNIRSVCEGKRKTAYGFGWKFMD